MIIFILFLLTSTLTTHAVDIVAIQNNSDTPVTIYSVLKERTECAKTLLIIIEPQTEIVLDKAISIPITPYQFEPITPYQFESIQKQVTKYFTITTKKGLFFCVEGEVVQKSRSFWGLWLQKKNSPNLQILVYTKGLSRFGTTKPHPGATEASVNQITLCIDTKGTISAH